MSRLSRKLRLVLYSHANTSKELSRYQLHQPRRLALSPLQMDSPIQSPIPLNSLGTVLWQELLNHFLQRLCSQQRNGHFYSQQATSGSPGWQQPLQEFLIAGMNGFRQPLATKQASSQQPCPSWTQNPGSPSPAYNTAARSAGGPDEQAKRFLTSGGKLLLPQRPAQHTGQQSSV